MHLLRLWQPRRALFWLWLLFNVLSSLCTWALHILPLNTAGRLLAATVALLNVFFGLGTAWLLVRDEPPQAARDGGGDAGGGGSSASTASTSE